MLVLSRKVGELLYLGEDIYLTVVEIDKKRVKLGIAAPKSLKILRAEIAHLDDAPGRDTRQEHGQPKKG